MNKPTGRRPWLLSMAAVVILAAFVTWFVPGFSRVVRATRDLYLLYNGRQKYVTDFGTAPSADAGLRALYEDTGNPRWKGPYLRTFPQADPWGHPYVYIAPNQSHPMGRILSYGSDGEPGGGFFAADLYFYM